MKHYEEVSVTLKNKEYDFYNVSPKLAKAVITILQECANTETEIIDAVGEKEQ